MRLRSSAVGAYFNNLHSDTGFKWLAFQGDPKNSSFSKQYVFGTLQSLGRQELYSYYIQVRITAFIAQSLFCSCKLYSNQLHLLISVFTFHSVVFENRLECGMIL